MQICGGKGAGKSSLMTNLLLNLYLLQGKFNRICWASPNAQLDAKLNILKTTPGIITPNYALIQYKNQKKRKSCEY